MKSAATILKTRGLTSAAIKDAQCFVRASFIAAWRKPARLPYPRIRSLAVASLKSISRSERDDIGQ